MDQERMSLVEAIVEEVSKIFAGKRPDIIGAALADLQAIWVAGHHPALRADILAMHEKAVRELIPVNDEILRNRYPESVKDWPPIESA
jgi:hypothetical protein